MPLAEPLELSPFVGHPQESLMLVGHAEQAEVAGDVETAERALVLALRVNEERFGAGSGDAALRAATLAAFLERQGRFEEALGWWQHCIGVYNSTPEGAPPATSLEAAGCAVKAGQAGLAYLFHQKAVLDAHAFLLAHPDSGPYALALAYRHYAEFLGSQEEFSQAYRMFEASTNAAPDDLDIRVNALIGAALCLPRGAQAGDMLREARDVLMEHQPDEPVMEELEGWIRECEAAA